MKKRISVFAILGIVLSAAILAACGAAPKERSMTMQITASSDVNPDLQSRPSPVVLHVLELSSIDEFNRASFFELTENATAVLGGDMLNKTEIILTPGGSRSSTLDLGESVAYIGLVAGYRDIDNARWRLSHQLVPGRTGSIVVHIGKQHVSITDSDD